MYEDDEEYDARRRQIKDIAEGIQGLARTGGTPVFMAHLWDGVTHIQEHLTGCYDEPWGDIADFIKTFDFDKLRPAEAAALYFLAMSVDTYFTVSTFRNDVQWKLRKIAGAPYKYATQFYARREDNGGLVHRPHERSKEVTKYLEDSCE